MTRHHPPGTRKNLRLFLTGVASVLIAIVLCGVTYSLFYAGTTQIVSTVATGTAPFVVASTTKVTNLNADLLNGQDGAYYNDSPGAWTCAVRKGSCSCSNGPCSCSVNVSCNANENYINYGLTLSSSQTYTPLNRSTVNCYTSTTVTSGSAAITCYLLCCQ